MEVSLRKPPYFIDEEEDEVSSSLCYKASNNLKNYTNMNHYHHYSPRSVVMSAKFNDFRFDNSYFRQPVPHFLDSCFLCKKPLGDNRDIFMYRGDTPFCSEECRGEQIERDEEKEKKQSLSSSVKAMRRNEKGSSSSSPTRSRRPYVFYTGTVAAA